MRCVLKLLKKVGCDGLLQQVNRVDIYKTINSCFTGERAKLLGIYVTNNSERLGLLCQ